MVLVLASASSRRAAMLAERYPAMPVSQIPLRARERAHAPGTPVCDQVERTLTGKASAATLECDAPLVVVADTLVEDPDDPSMPLGQPSDARAALTMLLRLAGRRHRVWSGTTILHAGEAHTFVESATVEIARLTDEQVAGLIESGSWRGKAGGYDLAGAMKPYGKLVEGDADTVLGFAASALRWLDGLLGDSTD